MPATRPPTRRAAANPAQVKVVVAQADAVI
jgi:hypothetical protein